MSIFTSLFETTLRWSKHRLAPVFLAIVAFAESSFFPIPPDVMLLAMGISRPKCAFRYALVASVFSVLGGIAGYGLGYFGFELVQSWLVHFNYIEQFNKVRLLFNDYGIWIVLLAGFSPIPYKLFTLTAGFMSMPLLPFVLASIVSRTARFYLVSTLVYIYGDSIRSNLRRYVSQIGWLVVAIFVMVLLMHYLT